MPPSFARLARALALVVVVGCGDNGNDPPDGAPPIPDGPTVIDASPDAPGGTRIHITVEPIPGATYSVIYRDGTGPWALATHEAGSVYSFPVASDRYGVGEICVDGGWQEATFAYALVTDDAPTLYASCGPLGPPPVPAHVTGTVSGLTGAGYRARIGSAAVNDTTGATTATYDVTANEGTETLMFGRLGASGIQHVNRFAIARDVPLSGDVVHDVAFGVDGSPTQSRPVDLVGITPIETTFSFAQFRTADFARITLTNDTAAPPTIDVPAAAQWAAGDRLVVMGSGDDFPAYRQALTTYAALADVPATIELSLPQALPGGVVSAVPADTHFQYRAVAGNTTDADSYQFYVFSFGVDNAGCDGGVCLPYWYLEATPGYVGTDLSLTTPDPADLEALGVWDDRLDTPAGSSVYVDLAAFHGDLDSSYWAGTTDQFDL